MSRNLLFGGNDATSTAPPRIGGQPKTFNTQVQDIASAAHARGVVILKGEQITGSIEAADLCRAIRAAWAATDGDPHKHDHVARLVGGISSRLGQKGGVGVSQLALNLLRGYASPRSSKRKNGHS